jgi:hypothetical protein
MKQLQLYCDSRVSFRCFSALFAALGLFSMGASASETAKPIASAFDSTVTKVAVKPGESTITAEWSYRNHWDFPLAVEKFDTSCGCLSGKTDQPALSPGQTGKFHAIFSPGLYRGLLRKSLHVRFVGHEKPVELVVEAMIPSHVELSSQELVWKASDNPEAKSIEIKSGTGQPFSITGLLGVPEHQFQFTILSETVEEKKHYRLSITPNSEAAGQHCLQVRTDSSDPRDSVQAVFLRVDKSPPTASGP